MTSTARFTDIFELPPALDVIASDLEDIFSQIGIVNFTLAIQPPTLTPGDTSPVVEIPQADALGLLGWYEGELEQAPTVVPIPQTVSSSSPAPGTTISMELEIAILGDVVVALAGLEGVSLVLNPGGFTAQFTATSEGFTAGFNIGLGIRLAETLLRPYRRVSEANGKVSFEPDSGRKYTQIDLASVSVTVDNAGNIDLNPSAGIQLTEPVMIGSTGVIIESADIELNLSGNGTRPSGTPANWKGLMINNASIRMPDVFSGAITATGLGIGYGGISGSVAATFGLVYTNGEFTGDLVGEVLGMQGGLKEISLTLQHNIPAGGGVRAQLKLPFFETTEDPLDINIGFTVGGAFTVAVDRPNGLITMSKPGILELTVDTVGFLVDNGIFTAKLSGLLKPLVGGLDWPSFEVNELAIDSQGKVRLDGGWLNLREQKPMNFHGFKVEITKLGFGQSEDGGKWIGFSGGVKLVDALPAGASVEGLRLVWYDDGSKAPSVTFNDVGIEFGVPNVIKFKGAVAYSGLLENTIAGFAEKEKVYRFDGDIKLKLMALNMEIDATLVIGSASGPRGDYSFFAIYIGVELPAGIPLWSTGLALYGMAGLFATQMEPNKGALPYPADEGWYENPDSSNGWYKRGTPGVTDLKTKWDPHPGSLAFGVGATIGTLPDNGMSFHGKFLLVIVFPGPIVLLEGKGDLLKKRSNPDKPGVSTIVDEPLFRALAVLDGRAGTFTVGMDAQYKYDEKRDLIDIHGGVEAFFDFHEAQAWHIYMGRKDPRAKRIQALFFKKLFEANAYFMLQGVNPFLQTGIWVGFDQGWNYGPASIKIEAFIQGDAVVSRKPTQFHGELTLFGNVKVAIFGLGFGLSVEANCLADVFEPFHVLFDFHIAIDLPWPLPDFEADVTHEWGLDPDPPPLALPLQEIAVEHLKVTTSWPLPRTGGQALLMPNYDDGEGFLVDSAPAFNANAAAPAHTPVVPLDSRPHITFGRAVNDDAKISVNSQPTEPEWEPIGDDAGPVRARYSLQEVELAKYVGGTDPWKRVAWVPNSDEKTKLSGSWAPVPGGSENIDQVKLWLWSKNPFDYTRHNGREWDEWFTSQFPNYPCVPPAPDREICCELTGVDPSKLSPPTWQCSDHPEIEVSWVAPDGSFNPNELTIKLPRGAKEIKITPSKKTEGHIRRCVDFRVYVSSMGPNPRIERGARFETFVPGPFATSVSTADTTIASAGGTGELGLDCRDVLEIVLPRPCYVAELILTSQAGSARVEAFNVDGSDAGAPVPVPLGRVRRVRLKGNAITRIVIRGGGETFLHQLCFEHLLVTVTGSDGDGNVFVAHTDGDGTIVVNGTDMTSVHVSSENPAPIDKVCVVLPPDPAEIIRREEMNKHLIDELALWSQEDRVLEPNTTYRLKVITKVEAQSDQALSSNQYTYKEVVGANPKLYRLDPLEQKEYAYFRTEGPPGLANYSLPVGQAISPNNNVGTVSVTNGSSKIQGTGVDWSQDLVDSLFQVLGDLEVYTILAVRAADQAAGTPAELTLNLNYTGFTANGKEYVIGAFDSGIGDLTPYVRQTIPATVPPVGQPPLLPRPVYRAYDVGVEFNENYVDLLYRMARRDLGLYLYNNNNQPVRDAQGKLIVLSNLWGEAEQLTLTESDERWIKIVNDCTNGKLDEPKIPHSKTLTSAVDGQVLDADTVYEARLVTLLLHEDFASYTVGASANGPSGTLDGWTVKDDSASTTPSHWEVAQAGTPPSRYIVQTSSISGGTNDGKDPVKPGTMLLRGDPAWTDYRLSAFLRATTNDDAMGVVFRSKDPNTYYRFSMDRERTYRRLVKVLNGAHIILAEDDFIYHQNVDYLITVEAIGSSLRVYQDGALVFAVIDDAISNGRIGLYCWSNAGVRFSDVRVDDFRANAPVPYRFKFTTSEFTNFFQHLHSYQDETWLETLPAATIITTMLAEAKDPSQLPTADEARAYESLLAKLPGISLHQNPREVQVTRVEQNSQALALLVQSPEPIDWQRTELQLAGAARWVPMPQLPDAVKLTDVAFGEDSPNEEFVTLLLREATNLTGYRIEQRQLPSPLTESGGSPVLFVEDFNGADSGVLFHEEFGSNALDHYTIVDEEAPTMFQPSAWTINGGHIVQTGNYVGWGSSEALPDRPGTIALIGPATWANLRIRATLRSEDRDDIGIVFRYQDAQNYYRFSMSRFGGYRRLIKKSAGVVKVLWEDVVLYNLSQSYRLVIETFGDRLLAYLDDALLFSVKDADVAAGRIGLYCWRNTGAHFEGLQVESLESDPILWQPAFSDMDGLEVVLDPGASSGSPNWSASGGVLSHSTHLIQGEDEAWEELPGAFADDIGVGADGSAWCTYILGSGQFWLFKWDGSKWAGVINNGGVRIAVDPDGFPWVVDDAQRIFKWDGNVFQQIPGLAYDIGIGPAGELYVIGTNPVSGGFGIYYRDGATWQIVPNGGGVRIAVGPDGNLWVVNDAQEVLVFRGDTATWQKLPGTAHDIGVGADGSVWITDPGNYRVRRWNGVDWEEFWGAGVAEIAVGPDGIPWGVTPNGTNIFRWSGNIYHKPGTYVVGGNQVWKDVQISVHLRTGSAGAVGVLFRHMDADNYYRFSMDRTGNYRRLIKKVNGKVSKLWEDQDQYLTNRAYEITVRAVGKWLSVYLDGVLLMEVRDEDIERGRVGFYLHGTNYARFERVLVKDYIRRVGQWLIKDEMQTAEPSQWRLKRGELSQTSNIGDDDALARLGTEVVAGDPTWRDYRLSARLRSETDDAIGVIFRYMDDDNYYRLSMDAERNYRRLVKKVNGSFTKIWEKAGGFKVSESFTLTVDAVGSQLVGYLDDERLFEVTDTAHLAGQVGLYCWGNIAAHFERVEVRQPLLEASALWHDRFPDSDLSGWSFQDQGRTVPVSQWLPVAGALQHQIISGVTFGAQALAGDPSWTDVMINVRLQPQDDGTIGLLFRYSDANHHYLFSMDSDNDRRQLVKNVAGTLTVLWEGDVGFDTEEIYELVVIADGGLLRGYINSLPMFVVEDDQPLQNGQIGLYCTANMKALFSDVRVYEADRAFDDWLLDESFDVEVAGRWTLVDEGSQSISPHWKVTSGELQQKPSINDTVWFEDALPLGAISAGIAETWNWIGSNPAPFSGAFAHQSNLVVGIHQHFFDGTTDTLDVKPGDALFAYVYLDPINTPSEVMLQWNDGSWEHRAYWGANNIGWGTDGTASRLRMGPLPVAGQWVRLEVSAKQVGLENKTLKGMAFTLHDGRATWDHAGTASRDVSTSGTYAVAGDLGWTDYRFSVRLVSAEANGAIGVMFRYKDENNFYRLYTDNNLGYGHLVKKMDGIESELWKDTVQYTLGRDHVLTVDCIGERLTGYLDGMEIFAWEDSDHSTGCIGLYCWANTGARFAEVRVATPVWVSHYIFNDEARMPTGTRVRVYQGNVKDAPSDTKAGIVERFSASHDNRGYLLWPKDGVDLRVHARGAVTGHMRRFLQDSAYTLLDVNKLRVLRKADGTGFFLAVTPVATPLAPAQYRLTMTYHRKKEPADSATQVLSQAGNSDPEQVRIDIPWRTA